MEVSLFAWLVSSKSSPIFLAAKETSILGSLFLAGLTTSILVYRAAFHRLNRFPGPFAARLSNMYPTMLSARKLQLYEEVDSLHKTYGDFVRVGPSELSINHPGAMTAIHSAQSRCSKGPWYNVLHPRVSLHMVRDKTEHARRRRVWDRGFSSKALRDYEPRVKKYTDQLLEHIEATKGMSINVTDWFNYYSFDVMGDLAFGKSFGMLASGTTHYFMKALHADMTNIGLFSHALWLFPLFKITPVLNAEHIKFWRWLGVQVDERKQMKPDRPDVFSWLLADHEAQQPITKQAEMDLVGDASLIVVAGSDTTAASLTALFFELALHKEEMKQVQEEVDQYFEQNPAADAHSLSKLSYLDAVINEALRLHPPVPSGVQRFTPPEGIQIGSVFVPGETIIQVPLHTAFRDERNFARPDEFVPERWTTKPELTINAVTYAPFSIGPYSCVGKQLGLMEMRYVAAEIVRKYDIALAPGQTPKAFLDGKRDTFTLALGPLNLLFTDRKV
ncbi:hypothetical protein BT93_L4670 [Corymbia citriodora subsp. variegata]|uniref:Cytochrome P450 n=1 Tax=Corymbia citriodora subsp. variegata TaxID=360336 RepID=A0A8T0CHQ2_CORYI|nr:hypothetical protein BT93_L4670 [Corymbia citriodora subsp. variegata]